MAGTFVKELLFKFGPAEYLRANNGKCFTAKLLQNVSRILNIHSSFTTTYHSQTFVQVARIHRSFKATIRGPLDDHPTVLDLLTTSSTYPYDCLLHTATALACFEVVLSIPQPPLPVKPYPKKYSPPQEANHEWKQCLAKSVHGARARLS